MDLRSKLRTKIKNVVNGIDQNDKEAATAAYKDAVPVIDSMASKGPDYRTSFSGSALPFFNKEQAFYNTSNKGKAHFSKCNKSTTIFLKYPNSYYTDLGNILVVPHVDLVYSIDGKEHLFTYKLSDNPIPYRSLTHPHTRTNPMFYQPKTNCTEVMSQSKLFRRTGFPTTNTSLNNFW